MWGATTNRRGAIHNDKFQSTHPCGVRQRGVKIRSLTRCFNPRTRVGCDFLQQHRQQMLPRFNPRTRVGCDASLFSLPIKVKGFNPRTRVGCDLLTGTLPVKNTVSIHAPVWGATKGQNPTWHIAEFQSTHPCGVRQSVAIGSLLI